MTKPQINREKIKVNLLYNSTVSLPDDLSGFYNSIAKRLSEAAPVLIAYSGGVDSSTLLAIAASIPHLDFLGVIADSPSLSRANLRRALETANFIGAEVEVIQTTELSDERYASNPPNRCYFCKFELFQRMQQLALERNFRSLAYGENADDPPRERPGSQAAREFRVIAPLRDAGAGKAVVRRLARFLNLPCADAPAEPCLSSRIVHGTRVTPQALALIEQSENFLRQLGFRILRVRYKLHNSIPQAIVQVAPDELHTLQSVWQKVERELLNLGFSAVTFDPNGYRGLGTL